MPKTKEEEIVWDFETRVIPAMIPDIVVLFNEERKRINIDIAVPLDTNMKDK
jgi:hypothetical protein